MDASAIRYYRNVNNLVSQLLMENLLTNQNLEGNSAIW